MGPADAGVVAFLRRDRVSVPGANGRVAAVRERAARGPRFAGVKRIEAIDEDETGEFADFSVICRLSRAGGSSSPAVRTDGEIKGSIKPMLQYTRQPTNPNAIR